MPKLTRRDNRRRPVLGLQMAAVLSAALTLMSTPVPAQELWVGAVEPFWRQLRHWQSNDFYKAFEEHEGWPPREVSVFNFSKWFMLTETDDRLRQVFSFLREHQIKMAVQGVPLPATGHSICGLGVEGYGAPNDMAEMAARIKALGGKISIVRMDEPLFYGHVYEGTNGKAGCHEAIPVLARQAASKMASIRAVFPDVLVGDVEPIGISGSERWTTLIEAWTTEYALAAGRPLDFLHVDVLWTRDGWQDQLRVRLESQTERASRRVSSMTEAA
jgi:hypothetical protein